MAYKSTRGKSGGKLIKVDKSDRTTLGQELAEAVEQRPVLLQIQFIVSLFHLHLDLLETKELP